MASLCLFDPASSDLAPLTDLRASFEIRTGVRTTLERWCAWWGGEGCERPDMLFAEDGLRDVLRERWECSVNDLVELRKQDEVLLASGRCIVPPMAREELERGSACVDADSGQILVALVDGKTAAAIVESGGAARDVREVNVEDLARLRHPWDIIRHRNEAMLHDFEGMTRKAKSEAIPTYVHVVGAGAIIVRKHARIMPGAVLDATEGPILIGEGALVRPNSVITGPAAIGAGSTVLDCAVIRAFTSVGPMCKVNGEVSGSIVQGYTNKAHDGFLGDSYLGKWVNLGAGTITSNLLNTYSEINARALLGMKRKATGLTFLGSLIADHTKTAIGTLLSTGTILGTGSMVARTAQPPTTLDRFSWLTDAGARTYRFEKFVEVARAAMARRGITPSDAYIERLRSLHALRAEHHDDEA